MRAPMMVSGQFLSGKVQDKWELAQPKLFLYVGGMFERGLGNLKTIVEAHK